MGIGKKLTCLMKEKNTNANELAQKTGVPAQTIYSLIRRDASKVEIDSLIKIAGALGVTAEYFCSDEEFTERSAAQHEPTYEDIQSLIARNGKALSLEQKRDIIRTLLSDD